MLNRVACRLLHDLKHDCNCCTFVIMGGIKHLLAGDLIKKVDAGRVTDTLDLHISISISTVQLRSKCSCKRCLKDFQSDTLASKVGGDAVGTHVMCARRHMILQL